MATDTSGWKAAGSESVAVIIGLPNDGKSATDIIILSRATGNVADTG